MDSSHSVSGSVAPNHSEQVPTAPGPQSASKHAAPISVVFSPLNESPANSNIALEFTNSFLKKKLEATITQIPKQRASKYAQEVVQRVGDEFTSQFEALAGLTSCDTRLDIGVQVINSGFQLYKKLNPTASRCSPAAEAAILAAPVRISLPSGALTTDAVAQSAAAVTAATAATLEASLRKELATAHEDVARVAKDLEALEKQNKQYEADLKSFKPAPTKHVTATCDAAESTLRKIHAEIRKDVTAALERYKKIGVDPVAIVARELSTDKDTLDIVWSKSACLSV